MRGWLAAFVFIGAFLLLLTDFVHTAAFLTDGSSTIGTVVAVEPENHNAARVEYSVDGREYNVTSSYKPVVDGGPAQFATGQHVTIYYLQLNPAVASLQPPLELVTTTLIQAGLLAALAAAFLIVLGRMWHRR